MADSFIIYDESEGDLTGISSASALTLLGLDADLATFSVPASTTISAFGATLVDDADQATAQATLGLTTVVSNSHVAATVSAPLSVSGQALSLVNDAAAAITEIDTGALANSDTVIPTSKAVTTAIAGFSGGYEPLTNGDAGTPELVFSDGDVLMAKMEA